MEGAAIEDAVDQFGVLGFDNGLVHELNCQAPRSVRGRPCRDEAESAEDLQRDPCVQRP